MNNDQAFRTAQAAYDRAEPPNDARLDAQYEIKEKIVKECRWNAKLRMEVIEEAWSPGNSPERIDNILDRMLKRNEPDSWVLTDLWQMLEDAMDRMAASRVAARGDK